jgi:hypothetical protein
MDPALDFLADSPCIRGEESCLCQTWWVFFMMILQCNRNPRCHCHCHHTH